MLRPALLFALMLGVTLAASASADVENNLVFTRQNGTTITFPAAAKTFAWCGPYEVGNVKTTTFHLITYDTTLTDGTYWRLWAIPADVTVGDTLNFPMNWTWPSPDSVHVFIGDPPNEISSNQHEDVFGWIVFQQLDCTEAAGGIEFTIDAQFPSEFGDGPWVAVQGSFRATLTGSPFVPARASTWGKIKSTYR
jgi:hypothetical protein